MRLFSLRFYVISAFFVNFVVAIIMWSYLDNYCQHSDVYRIFINKPMTLNSLVDRNHAEDNASADLSDKFVVVIRDFEFFENDVVETAKSVISILPRVKVVILSDSTIYPPLQDMNSLHSKVHIIATNPLARKALPEIYPGNFLDREHVLLVPDSTRFDSDSQVRELFRMHQNHLRKIVAIPVGRGDSHCLSLNVSIRHWTIKYRENNRFKDCEALQGDHVLLVTKTLLMQMNQPFARPFPHSLFIQSTMLNVKIEILRNVTFRRGSVLFTDVHKKWKRESLEKGRKEKFYQDFGIKKVLLPAARVEWYGCAKNTQRCFGTVVNDMPDYLFDGKWTPPCCLENLQQTGRYVFGVLEKCNVRYWLEGGSLLGAVRTGDIIPWDYDIDVGIYKEDIVKCEWLKNTEKQSFVDMQGFVWEKAQEGDFIRVQYSDTNHLHVDIFPFYPKNGLMTKETWLPGHKQDMEFPEHYLRPLKKIKFIGVFASVPNNHREFLEMKFGKGAIEIPNYAVPQVLNFSRRTL